MHRNVDDALPLALRDARRSTNGSIEEFFGAKVELRAEYETQIRGLLFALDDENKNLVVQFRAMYLAYMSNPCDSFDWFTKGIDDLTKGQQRLTTARMYLHALIELAQDQRNNRTKILDTYLAVVERIGGRRLHSSLGYRTPQEVLDEYNNTRTVT